MAQRQHARQEDAAAAAQLLADVTGIRQYVTRAPYSDGARWWTGYDVVEQIDANVIAWRDPQTVEVVA